MWHSAHLRVIDLCHRGRQRPDDTSPKVGTSTPSSGFIIDIRRILLRIGSLSGSYIRTVKIIQGILVVASHPPALGWGIELIFIGIDS
jgi:hypothetical protein